MNVSLFYEFYLNDIPILKKKRKKERKSARLSPPHCHDQPCWKRW